MIFVPSLDLPEEKIFEKASRFIVVRAPEKAWPKAILNDSFIRGDQQGRPYVLISDPQMTRDVLMDKGERFVRWEHLNKVSTRELGKDNMVLAEGPHSKKLRRAVLPLLASSQYQRLIDLCQSSVGHFVHPSETNGHHFSPLQCYSQVSLDVIWRQIFGHGPDQPPHPLVLDFADQLEELRQPGRDAISLVGILKRLVETAQFESTGDQLTGNNPFKQLTLDGESGDKALTRQEAIDNLLTMVIGGYETTVNVLSFATWFLGQDPELQEQVHAELDEVTGGAPFDVEQTQKLKLLGAVVNETMRLISPVYSSAYVTMGEQTLGGHKLAPDTVIILAYYALHRNSQVWPNPETFDVSRWESGIPRDFSFVPFGAGARGCIGINSNIYELKAIMAAVLQRYRIETHNAADMELFTQIYSSTGPKHDMQIDLHLR
ncbi:cytochrome P450 [Rhodovibrionaceae bacterium A322]